MRGTRHLIVTAAIGAVAVLGVGGVAAATSGSGSSSDSPEVVTTSTAKKHVKHAPVRVLADGTTTTVDDDTTTTTVDDTTSTTVDDTSTTVPNTSTTVKAGADDKHGCDGKGHEGAEKNHKPGEHKRGLARAAQVRQDDNDHAHRGSHHGSGRHGGGH